MPNPECLSHEQLQALITADLPEQSADELFAHLESCADCRSTLDAQHQRQNKNRRSFVQKPLDEEPIIKEPAFQRAVKQIAQFGAEDSIYIDHLAKDPRENKRDQLNLAGEQIDQYRIVTKLGEGGMGTVYKAVHTKLDKVVALKIIATGSHVPDERIARFEREMLSVGRLNHPHIVGATDAREIDGTHFLVMEYLEGINLSQLIERMGPLPIADACEIIRQAAVGLQYAHQHDLIHRDIKPSNLMLTTEGQVKILDLGLALIQGDEPIEAQNGEPAEGELTSAGQILGTLGYMAPEQIGHSHDVDIRADLYSLGCTFFKLLTGEVPFEHLNATSISRRIKAHSNETAPSVLERRIEIPDKLSAILERLLAKSPSERYEDPGQLVQALESFTKGSNLEVLTRKTEQQVISAPGRDQRKWRLKTAAAVVVTLLLTVFALQLATNNGKITITSFDPALEIIIKRNGRIVDNFALRQRPQSTSYFAGEYEVEIKGGAPDGATIKNGRFKLTRGKSVLVEIVHAKTVDTAQSTHSDRAAAEWVLSVGGILSLKKISSNAKRRIEVKLKNMLPAERFEVRAVGFGDLYNRKKVNDDNIINLKGLSELTSLSLTQTEVTRHGISQLASLPSLNRIMMPYKFDEKELGCLSQLKGLKHVELSTPNYTDACIIHLNKLPQLIRLELVKTAITEKGFKQLSAQQLSSIRLCENFELYEVALKHFQNLQNFPKLIDITIIGNRTGRVLTDSGLMHLQKIKQLRQVSLINTNVTVAGIAALKQALPACKVDWNGPPQVKLSADPERAVAVWVLQIGGKLEIDVDGSIRDIDIEKLEDLPDENFRVTQVGFDQNSYIDDESLSNLSQLQYLDRLLIVHKKVSGAGFKYLSAMQGLQSLDCSGSLVTNQSLSIVKKLHDLVYLNLHSTRVTDEGIQSILPMKKLLYLNLSGVSDTGVRHLTKMTQLQFLVIESRNVTDDGLKHLGTMKNLVNLALTQAQLTDQGLVHLTDCHNLRMLDLSQTPISDLGLKQLSKLKSLTKLRLLSTKVTAKGVAELKKSVPQCTIVY
ncbi:serine/threonine-protein kinase [Gimesia algae]|uniref:Serine/threonine-protein kinase StkP n=1 Tax=Gimesia algae TaxID=2527971 RepID=A0A517V9Z5_9PLAN|nr:serine/threonine-protein kinase [Gimesia algae]QDT89827.1 Serine/threonine-protein kinase StkP [Gimesia algae]